MSTIIDNHRKETDHSRVKKCDADEWQLTLESTRMLRIESVGKQEPYHLRPKSDNGFLRKWSFFHGQNLTVSCESHYSTFKQLIMISIFASGL